MSEYLADVHMPSLSESKEGREMVVEDVDGDTGEENSNFVYSDEEQGVEEEQVSLPPPPEKKVKLKKEDIFKAKSAPPVLPKKVKKTVKPRSTPEPLPELDEPIIPKVKQIKPKRVMSDKQKEALRKGREAKAALRARPQTPYPAQEEPRHVAPEPAPAPAPLPQPGKLAQHQDQKHYYSKQDLEEMVFKGVEQYDTQRKARKAKKQKAALKENHDKKVFSEINSALNRTQHDPWAECFR
tara:strand:+ start:126 stop:845 length:720 start_codon:yes stop_codon:yes gene_type:complete